LPFGYHRAEVLAAFVSVLILWQVTLGLIYSAIQRMIALQSSTDLHDIELVDGKLMFRIALLCLIVNIILLKILGHSHHGHSHHGHSHHGCSHHGHETLPTTVTALSKAHHHHHDEEDCAVPACDHGTHDEQNMNVRAAYLHAMGDLIQSLGMCLAGAIIW
jgi:zinc transporter 2